MQATPQPRTGKSFALFLLCLVVLLGVLFHACFEPRNVLFSNDGPLGAINQAAVRLPGAFSGVWYDLNGVGVSGGTAMPNLTQALFWVLGPLGQAKSYPAFAMLFVGMCAWVFFRCSGMASLACWAGGLAAALNSDFFSVACWGVGPQTLCIGFNFLAYAALAAQVPRWPWAKYVLAGLAVGMGVMEGADVGLIFSCYFAAYVFHRALTQEGAFLQKAARGLGRVAMVAAVAMLIAAAQICVQIGTSVKGVTVTKRKVETPAEHWNWATQWSLPKRETASLFVPGLFGYRMTSSQEGLEGGDYWGGIGRHPIWDQYFERGGLKPSSGAGIRYNGGGIYAGVLVVLVAVWALAQAFRNTRSALTLAERKQVWFWAGAALVALLLAYGRFAPFYRVAYALPFVSKIRNPAKHIHPCSLAIIVMFGYGVQALWRTYMAVPAADGARSFRAWWKSAPVFDRRWLWGCLIAIEVGLVGWVVYGLCKAPLVAYLRTVDFDAASAEAIASFSIRHAGFFVILLSVSAILMLLILRGTFAGTAAQRGSVLLCALLIGDLGWANEPWIVIWDYHEKNSTNPVIDLLRDKPYEHRVAVLPLRGSPQMSWLDGYYRLQWAQHEFPYFNIQSLDIVQLIRMPEDWVAFEDALAYDGDPNNQFRITRRLELTNTRYLLGAMGALPFLNEQIDPAHRFRVALQFDITQKPGISHAFLGEHFTAIKTNNGPYAVIEFTGALPRASLYTNWLTVTNEQEALRIISSPDFDPQKSVVVGVPLPASSARAPATTNAPPGTAEISHYQPNDIVLKADARQASVLLLNDRFDPDWEVFVDRKPGTIFRCNYLMRGVALEPGTHEVELRFQPQHWPLMLSSIMIALGLGLLLAVAGFSRRADQPVP